MKPNAGPRTERRWRTRSKGLRALPLPSQMVVVLTLVALNVMVFAVQHLTFFGYQKLVPEGGRVIALQAAQDLRSQREVSLAMALEKRLHVVGELDRVLARLDEKWADSKAKLAELRALQANGSAIDGLTARVSEAESAVRTFRKVRQQLKPLPALLGASHEAGGVSLPDLREGRVWTLLTHMFVHGSVMHLALNMVVMIAAGTFVVMCLGGKHFLVLFFSGGLVGAGLQVSFFPNIYLIGASAGVYAITIAALLLLPEDTFYRFHIRLRPHLAAVGVTIVALVMLVITMASGGSSNPQEQSVAHLAHLGGVITGWYYVRMLGISPRSLAVPSAFRVSQEMEQ